MRNFGGWGFRGVSAMKLPEMSVIDTHLPSNHKTRAYTSEQILAWGKACAAAQKEADAKLIEEYPYWLGTVAKREIAAAIRGTT